MSSLSLDFIVDGRRLRVLRELADRGTVIAVAQALHLTPSAVSQQIANLGRSVGAPLVERQGRGVRLTAQARILLAHADRIATDIELARLDLEAHAEGLTGSVTIGAFSSAISGLVTPCLRELADARPNVTIRLVECEDADAFTALAAGELDILLFARVPTSPPDADTRFHQRAIHRDPFSLMLPEDHPLAMYGEKDPPPLALSAAAGEPFIASGQGACAQTVAGACVAAGFTPRVLHRCSDYGTYAALVAGGSCVALVPQLVFATAPHGTVLRQLTSPVPARVITLACRAGTEGAPLLAPVLATLTAFAGKVAGTCS